MATSMHFRTASGMSAAASSSRLPHRPMHSGHFLPLRENGTRPQARGGPCCSPSGLPVPRSPGAINSKSLHRLKRHNRSQVPSALPPASMLNEVAQLAEFEVESGLFYLPTWTADQIAGLLFGALMLACFLLAQSFDNWVARQQREELGICTRCGGVNDPAACEEGDCPYRKGQ